MQITEFYAVVTQFPNLGFGSAGDASLGRGDAYDQFAEAVGDEQPTRAFHLTFDVETGEIETCSEVTSDFQDEYEARTERWAAE